MANVDKSNADTQAAEIEQVRMKINFLERVVLILVMAVLAVSVCLNVYKYWENLVQQRQLDYLRQNQAQYVELHQFAQQLVFELHNMSRSNKDVRDMLIKYRPTLGAFGLAGRNQAQKPTIPTP